MTLVGLASLIVGGAGIANAVQAFVTRKMGSIATFKCLGASSRDVLGIYLTEILLVGAIAIAIGLAAGAVAPLLVAAAARLPSAAAGFDRNRDPAAAVCRCAGLSHHHRLRAVAAGAHAARGGLRPVPLAHRAGAWLAGHG